jgi:TolA-binding protein
MEKVIDITAKREGFRRAGMTHSEKTRTWPLDKFTPKQIKDLQSEPMLVVAIRNADDHPIGPDDSAQVKTLTEQLDAANGQIKTLTGQLADEQAKNKSILDLHEDVRAEATQQLEDERQKTSELATELDGERQKVADLTAQLEAATKKGK